MRPHRLLLSREQDRAEETGTRGNDVVEDTRAQCQAPEEEVGVGGEREGGRTQRQVRDIDKQSEEEEINTEKKTQEG